jgi:hypothetical protein
MHCIKKGNNYKNKSANSLILNIKSVRSVTLVLVQVRRDWTAACPCILLPLVREKSAKVLKHNSQI